MIKIDSKVELVIKVTCLFIIVMLCLAVYFNGRKLDCDKCSIDFKHSKSLPTSHYEIFTFKVINLYNNWTQGNCVLYWDKYNGFIDKSQRIIIYENLN